MSLRIVFRRAAKEEFDDAAAWYEERQIGLGSQLVSEVQKAIVLAAQTPEKFPIKSGAIRCISIRRFPYSVFYLHEPTRIVVMAVFHSKRNPLIWQSRK